MAIHEFAEKGRGNLNHATSIKLRPFSGLAPSKLKICPKITGVGYVCIQFDTIFNMGCWGGGGTYSVPHPWIMGRENRPWTRGLSWGKYDYVSLKKTFKVKSIHSNITKITG